MKSKHAKWLVRELPGLVEEGVLSEYYAEALREHYQPQEEQKYRRPALLIWRLLRRRG